MFYPLGRNTRTTNKPIIKEPINNAINPINISNLKRVVSVHAGLFVLDFLVALALDQLRTVSVYWIRATCWSVWICSAVFGTILLRVDLLGSFWSTSSGIGVGGRNCGMVGMPLMGGIVGMTA